VIDVPQTVHAWLEDEDRSGAEVGIAAIADDLIVTSGDNLRLRKDLPKIGLMYAWTEFAAYELIEARLKAPSLGGNHLRITKGPALTYLAEGQIYDFRKHPLDVIRPGDNVTGYGTDALPAGKYQMLGARVENALGVAARFVFKGIEARPAVIPVTKATDHVHSFSQFWGKPLEFEAPDGLPDLEILAAGTGTSVVELYLNGPRAKL